MRVAARDWLVTGVLAVLLGLVFLLVPQTYTDAYAVDEISGTVTADILLVGILGAWAIIVGVQLAIAAFTLRVPRPASSKPVSAWTTRPRRLRGATACGPSSCS
jgi:hypothetical protein